MAEHFVPKVSEVRLERWELTHAGPSFTPQNNNRRASTFMYECLIVEWHTINHPTDDI